MALDVVRTETGDNTRGDRHVWSPKATPRCWRGILMKEPQKVPHKGPILG